MTFTGNKIEIWKDIPDYIGEYQISNLGRVKSLERMKYTKYYKNGLKIKEKILKNRNNGDGYLTVLLNNKKEYVHRLVAKAFIKSESYYKEVNHIDGNKQNNNVENLEWCTRKENMIHSCKVLLNDCKPVIGINISNNAQLKFRSMSDAKNYGFKVSGISACCKRKRKSHHGFKWYYLEDFENGFSKSITRT